MTVGIVKKSLVKDAGRCSVGVAVGSGKQGFAAAANAAAGASARIVEQDARRAIVEVVCSCGKRITLQCEYAAGPAAGAAAGKIGNQ